MFYFWWEIIDLPFLHSDHRVTGVRDLTTGYDSTQLDKKAILPVSASSQMVRWKMMMIEILMIMIITLTTIVKIIDHEISDHILAPVRGLQCCDPHPANKWHRAKDKVFSWFFLWWHMYILNVAATLKKKHNQGVPHKVPHVSYWTRTSRRYFSFQFCQK